MERPRLRRMMSDEEMRNVLDPARRASGSAPLSNEMLAAIAWDLYQRVVKAEAVLSGRSGRV